MVSYQMVGGLATLPTALEGHVAVLGSARIWDDFFRDGDILLGGALCYCRSYSCSGGWHLVWVERFVVCFVLVCARSKMKSGFDCDSYFWEWREMEVSNNGQAIYILLVAHSCGSFW